MPLEAGITILSCITIIFINNAFTTFIYCC
jgi:hypothetical protein